MKNRVINFGCRLNIYEGEIIHDNLQKLDQNNIVVINTCSVTKEAQRQAKQTIRSVKKNNPSCKIIVTGCAAQINPELFIEMREVDKVLGNEEKLDSQNYDLNKPNLIQDIMQVKTIVPRLVRKLNKTRAFIQIQNGCNYRCTFCVIPYARGNSRSVPLGFLYKQIKYLIDNGYKEVVLTGVNITSYGRDLPGKPTLAQMIKRLLNLIPELQRFRLSSIDIADVDGELFDLLVCEKKLMPYFHLSLQSGDNYILKKMNRRNTREQVIDFCYNLRFVRPDIVLGADIIVGFPTEDETMFLNTVNLIKESRIQYLHVFPYSSWKKTLSSFMPQIDKSIIKQRVRFLKNLANRELILFYKQNLGHITQVLLEKKNFGYSSNFIPILIDKNLSPGSLVNVKLTQVYNNYKKPIIMGNVINA